MKCVMTLDKKHIKRVTDEEASELFQEGGWRYISKSVWKEKVRDVEETPIKTPKTTKTNRCLNLQKDIYEKIINNIFIYDK